MLDASGDNLIMIVARNGKDSNSFVRQAPSTKMTTPIQSPVISQATSSTSIKQALARVNHSQQASVMLPSNHGLAAPPATPTSGLGGQFMSVADPILPSGGLGSLDPESLTHYFSQDVMMDADLFDLDADDANADCVDDSYASLNLDEFLQYDTESSSDGGDNSISVEGYTDELRETMDATLPTPRSRSPLALPSSLGGRLPSSSSTASNVITQSDLEIFDGFDDGQPIGDLENERRTIPPYVSTPKKRKPSESFPNSGPHGSPLKKRSIHATLRKKNLGSVLPGD